MQNVYGFLLFFHKRLAKVTGVATRRSSVREVIMRSTHAHIGVGVLNAGLAEEDFIFSW